MINMSNDTPVTYLDLHTLKDKLKDVKVLDKSDVPFYLYLKIPSGLSENNVLIDILDETSGQSKQIDFLDFVSRDCFRPWIRIESRILDLSHGQHVYRFQFINRRTDDIFNLYCSYIINDTNAEKPFVYMKEDGTECSKLS